MNCYNNDFMGIYEHLSALQENTGSQMAVNIDDFLSGHFVRFSSICYSINQQFGSRLQAPRVVFGYAHPAHGSIYFARHYKGENSKKFFYLRSNGETAFTEYARNAFTATREYKEFVNTLDDNIVNTQGILTYYFIDNTDYRACFETQETLVTNICQQLGISKEYYCVEPAAGISNKQQKAGRANLRGVRLSTSELGISICLGNVDRKLLNTFCTNVKGPFNYTDNEVSSAVSATQELGQDTTTSTNIDSIDFQGFINKYLDTNKPIETLPIVNFISTLPGRDKSGGRNSIYRLQLFLNAYIAEQTLVDANNGKIKYYSNEAGHIALTRKISNDPDLKFCTADREYSIEVKICNSVSNYENMREEGKLNFHNAEYALVFLIDDGKWYFSRQADNYAILNEADYFIYDERLKEIVCPAISLVHFESMGGALITSSQFNSDLPKNVKLAS